MKRKILSLILVFAMTVSLFTVGTGAVEPTYGDTAGHWAESSIERWSAYGIIQGSNGLFDPNGQLTCAQLATILAKLLKLPAAKDAGFIDNKADAWYYDAINRCAAAGILNGNGDGTVTPEAPITRERAMVMLARALGIEPISNPDLSKYADAAQVSAYAQGMVAAMIEAGIVGGVTANELAPQANINRASTVTILDRAIDTYADQAGETVKADGKGIVLVVADDVTVTGDVDKLLVPADNVEVTVSGSKNIDDITVTGDNSKVILNNATANDVTLDGKNTELETKGGSKVENVSVTEDAKGATVNVGSGTTIKNVENSAADTTVTGSGTVKNVASDTDITVETKNTNVENSGDEKITVTDAKGKDSTVSSTGSGSSTVVNKETTSSGSGSSGHSHSYDTSKWVFDDTKHWHASTCGHDLKIDEAEHSFGEDNLCTVCGQVKADVAVAKIGSKNYKTLAEAVAAATNGQTVTLVDNVTQNTSLTIEKSITLNLNGKKIANTEDIWHDAEDENDVNIVAMFSIENGAKVTITGDGEITAKENDCYTFNIKDASELTIENGKFVGNVSVVQVQKGTLIVDGGEFSLLQKWNGKSTYLLNCVDAAYADGTAKVFVKGGTFVDFNPADNAAEGAGTSFLAENCFVIPEEDNKFTVSNATEIPVTTATVQDYLDGKYGSINGKTLVLGEGSYSALELGRATKYVGSNTEYYILTNNDINSPVKYSYKEFCSIKNNGTWSGIPWYIRSISNVTFKAADDAEVNIAGIYASSGHKNPTPYDYVLDRNTAYYLEFHLSGITFDGITFTAKSDINTSLEQSVIDGFTFKNCTFNINNTVDGNQAIRYYNENNNGKVSGLVVDSCKFYNCYQGVFTSHIKNITVTNSEFDTTGHNAIGIQDFNGACDHGIVVISGNNFTNIHDRIIRFNNVGAGTTITIIHNTATNSGDDSSEVIRATSLADGVNYNIHDNSWGESKIVANDQLKDSNVSA